MKISAVIVAAGASSRYGKDKLNLPYHYGSVLQDTVVAFLNHNRINEVIVVVEKGKVKSMQNMLPHCIVVAGGKSRTESVKAGVERVQYNHVLIHDGARPGVTKGLIDRVVCAMYRHKAVVPVMPVTDSLVSREIGYVSRDEYGYVQTPQGFETALLRQCLAATDLSYSDEGSLVERFHPIYYVQGDVTNRKLTHPVDYYGLLGKPHSGIGYDIHRLVEGRELWLGGVHIPYVKGLLGHSDADCVVHAVMDAMLSSVGEADIGHRFPVDDARWENARSQSMMQQVVQDLHKKRVHVGQISISIIAEQPHLSPYVEQMRMALADMVHISKDMVGIAVTTNEGVPLDIPFAKPTTESIAAIATVITYQE